MYQCDILMLIAGSTVSGHFLAVTRIPMIVIIALIYLLGGSFLGDLAFLILAGLVLCAADEAIRAGKFDRVIMSWYPVADVTNL